MEKIFKYAKQKGYSDIVELCRIVIENLNEEKDVGGSYISNQVLGEVYLFKSGRYYKDWKNQ